MGETEAEGDAAALSYIIIKMMTMINVECLMFDVYLRTSLLLLLHMGIKARRRRSKRSLREFFKRGGWWKSSWRELLREGKGEQLIQALLIVSSSTHCHLFLKIVTTTMRAEINLTQNKLFVPQSVRLSENQFTFMESLKSQ